MVDVDRRMTGLNPAHLAGLRRLSARAAASAPSTPFPARTATSSRKILDTSACRRRPRWVELWSDAAAEDSNSSSSTSPERHVDASTPEPPKWVEKYIEQIGWTLKQGGWDESDVAEIVHVSSSRPLIVCEMALSDSLREAGWSTEEVSSVLWFELTSL